MKFRRVELQRIEKKLQHEQYLLCTKDRILNEFEFCTMRSKTDLAETLMPRIFPQSTLCLAWVHRLLFLANRCDPSGILNNCHSFLAVCKGKCFLISVKKPGFSNRVDLCFLPLVCSDTSEFSAYEPNYWLGYVFLFMLLLTKQ